MELILASTSIYRRTLLERLGVPFRCLSPEIDEETLKAEYARLPPAELAVCLAEAKASSVGMIESSSTVVGADQLVAFENEILGKPGDLPGAEAQLLRLAGRTHELITAVSVWHEGRNRTHAEVARMNMRRLTLDEIRRYVAHDRPSDCAGAYKLESRGVALFDRIEARDHTAITGLPLIEVTTILREIGFQIP